MFLSVIVPIYNVELYIKECLESIISQLSEGIEVVLINDGSSDDSMVIVEQLLFSISKQLRKQFIIINQENRGLSAARNAGIDIARGKYLTFVDSDDILFSNYFSEIMSSIENNYADVIQFKFLRFYNSKDNIIPYNFYYNYSGLHDVDDCLVKVVFNAGCWYSCIRVYHNRLFESIRFPNGFNFEDIAIVPLLLLKARSIFFIDKALYAYRFRQTSISNSNSSSIVQKNCDSFDFVLNRYSVSTVSNPVFFIVLFHTFKSSIDYKLRMLGFRAAYRHWSTYYPLISSNFRYYYLISKVSHKFFLKISKIGFVSFLLVKFLTVCYDVSLRVKDKVFSS